MHNGHAYPSPAFQSECVPPAPPPCSSSRPGTAWRGGPPLHDLPGPSLWNPQRLKHVDVIDIRNKDARICRGWSRCHRGETSRSRRPTVLCLKSTPSLLHQLHVRINQAAQVHVGWGNLDSLLEVREVYRGPSLREPLSLCSPCALTTQGQDDGSLLGLQVW